jgi:hypothetical protein
MTTQTYDPQFAAFLAAEIARKAEQLATQRLGLKRLRASLRREQQKPAVK